MDARHLGQRAALGHIIANELRRGAIAEGKYLLSLDRKQEIELPLPHRFYARAELAGLFYFLRTGTTSAMSYAPTYRAGIGLGVAF